MTIGLVPINVFTGYKEIITRELDQGALRIIGLIHIILLTVFKVITSID